MIGHLTQLVWSRSKLIGCALQLYTENDETQEVTLCDYGPGGNVNRQPVYIIGERCSKCPPGAFCSPRYPGLCTTRKEGELINNNNNNNIVIGLIILIRLNGLLNRT